jgi:hypothetical protein
VDVVTKTLRCEVWRYKGVLIVFTDDGNGGGTRVAGPKLLPGHRTLVGEFHLSEDAIATMKEELDQCAG